jgi:hypothetical protein
VFVSSLSLQYVLNFLFNVAFTVLLVLMATALKILYDTNIAFSFMGSYNFELVAPLIYL